MCSLKYEINPKTSLVCFVSFCVISNQTYSTSLEFCMISWDCNHFTEPDLSNIGSSQKTDKPMTELWVGNLGMIAEMLPSQAVTDRFHLWLYRCTSCGSQGDSSRHKDSKISHGTRIYTYILITDILTLRNHEKIIFFYLYKFQFAHFVILKVESCPAVQKLY